MNSAKNWLIVLLALSTLGSAFIAWRQHDELVARQTAAMPRDERADFQKRVWDLEKANRELKQAASASRQSTPDEPVAAPGKSGRVPERDSGAQMTAMRELLAKPEVQALVALQQRGAIEARYAALFRSLNLPPDRVTRLTSLLGERTSSLLDIAAVARDQGIDPRTNAAAFQQLAAQTQEEINQSIRGTLGEAGFAQFNAFEQTFPQRSTVEELQQRLSYTSTPLSAAQAEQLVPILAANAPPRPATGNPVAMALNLSPLADGAGLRLATGQGTGPAPITTAAVNQSQTVLTPPQVATLQQMQLQQQAQQQLRQLVTDTLGGTLRAGGAAGGKK